MKTLQHAITAAQSLAQSSARSVTVTRTGTTYALRFNGPGDIGDTLRNPNGTTSTIAAVVLPERP